MPKLPILGLSLFRTCRCLQGFQTPWVSMNMSCRHLGAPPYQSLQPFHLFFCSTCVCCVCVFGSNSIEDTWKGNGSTEVRGLNDFQLSVGSVWDLLVDSKGEISLGLVGQQSNTPTALDQGWEENHIPLPVGDLSCTILLCQSVWR